MLLVIEVSEAAIKVAIANGDLIEEDGVILKPETNELVKEIQQKHIEDLMDKALTERDFDMCKKISNISVSSLEEAK